MAGYRFRPSRWIQFQLWLGVGVLSCAPLALACSVNVGAISFAQFNPLADSASYGSGVIDVSCPSITSYTVALSPGQGTYSARYMTGGEHQLSYNLHTSPAYDSVWGDGSGISVQVGGSAGVSGNSHTVYGRLPAQPAAVVGQYSDVIVVTVSY